MGTIKVQAWIKSRYAKGLTHVLAAPRQPLFGGGRCRRAGGRGGVVFPTTFHPSMRARRAGRVAKPPHHQLAETSRIGTVAEKRWQ
jgi:hypothetical protein